MKLKHGIASLPVNLTNILSDSNNIYKGLDEIDELFESVAAKINELELLSIESEVFFQIDETR